jgi:DNA-binding beta-propeller fold protein YncE
MRDKAIVGCLLCVLFLGCTVGAAQAPANRVQLVKEVENEEKTVEWLSTDEKEKIPAPEGEIEGACGLAVSPGPDRNLYVSDYYHRRIDVFSLSGEYSSQIVLPEVNPVFGINTLDGVCGLAFDSAGNLYANEFHERVLRLRPTEGLVDPSEPTAAANKSTGVAVDSAGNVYVDDRTYVAAYKAPVEAGDEPVEKIGLGSLEDAYGIAAFGGKVYVPDAASDEIEVYEPKVDPLNPVATISHGFVSLVDAAVAVDPTNGHLLVVDNLQPGFEHPKAAIYEFDSAGGFLGRLPGEPIDGEPSGLAVDPGTGKLFVTTGNTEKANVFAYGPFTESPLPPSRPPVEAPASAPVGVPAAASRRSDGTGSRGGSAASASDIVQRGPVRVSFDGKITPSALPRHGMAPVGIAVETKIAAVSGGSPPQLRRISIAINRNGRFTSKGLPVCRLRDIQPSTSGGALAACSASLVGEGHFSANVQLPEQSPFPSAGKVLVFNGRLHGKPALFAHIYGTEPAPTSNVLPFAIRGTRGTYGTILEASLPQATGNWGYVTGLRMTLKRRFSYRGKARSFLSAGCPAPAGFPGAVFPLARTSFDFAGGMTLVSVLSKSCTAKG